MDLVGDMIWGYDRGYDSGSDGEYDGEGAVWWYLMGKLVEIWWGSGGESGGLI